MMESCLAHEDIIVETNYKETCKDCGKIVRRNSVSMAKEEHIQKAIKRTVVATFVIKACEDCPFCNKGELHRAKTCLKTLKTIRLFGDYTTIEFTPVPEWCPLEELKG